MNFYKHHIGDYAQATAHLSFVEDAAYSRLIRKYYAEERPLPADLKQVQRLVGARSREEREAVETVLAEFFTLDADGWHQARCDAEIAAATESQGEHEIKKANERERQRRHRERRKQLFDMLREHGEVPSYDTPTDELVALLSRVTQRDVSRDVTQPVTRDATANQTPDTRHQTPDVKQQHNHGGQSRAPDGPVERNVEVSVLLRGLGVMPMTGMHPLATEFANTGATDDQLRAAVDIARQRKPAPETISPNYLRPILAEVMNPQAPRPTASRADARAQERADVHAILSGRKPSHERTPDAIDVEARVVE